MSREEAPGAQRRGLLFSWMEGERGEDGGSGAPGPRDIGHSGASPLGRGSSRP